MNRHGNWPGGRRNVEISGHRIESTGHTYIQAERFRPLRDFLLVRPLPWSPSKSIQIAGDTRRTLRGEVIKAGPGIYPKRYNQDRSKCWDSKAFRPTEAKVGDVIELGGLHIDGYDWPQLTDVDTGEQFIVCRDEDVAGIVQ